MTKTFFAALSSVALAATLTACGSDEEAPVTKTTASASPAAETTAAASSVTVTDPWIKAVESGMTGAFGTITNTSDAEITLTAATTTAAKSVELHETTMTSDGASAMQEREGGFAIPAGGSLVLEPGGNHLMLMGVDKAIKPGDAVAFTLTFADGNTVEFEAVAKDFSGAQETYAPDSEHGSDEMHGDDKHAEDDHSDHAGH